MKSKIILFLALIATATLSSCTTTNGISPHENRTSGDLTAGLQMSLTILGTNKENPEFQISILNAGKEDICLNLGGMLANGKVLEPNNIWLTITDSSGRQTKLRFFDRKFAAVGGRVDDYVVPLRSGSNYTLDLQLDDFISANTWKNANLKPGRYEVSFHFEGKGAETMNADMGGVKLMNFWKGKLNSNDAVLYE